MGNGWVTFDSGPAFAYGLIQVLALVSIGDLLLKPEQFSAKWETAGMKTGTSEAQSHKSLI